MLRTHIAAAIGCARGNVLDEIMREVWTRHGAGQLAEDEAEQLSTLAQERRAALRGSGQGTFSLVLPPPAERCPTPVRRRSHFKGRSEGRIWRPTNRQEVQKVLLAAKRYELAERQKGERTGPLGSVAFEVLEYFVNLAMSRHRSCCESSLPTNGRTSSMSRYRKSARSSGRCSCWTG